MVGLSEIILKLAEALAALAALAGLGSGHTCRRTRAPKSWPQKQWKYWKSARFVRIRAKTGENPHKSPINHPKVSKKP